MAQSLPYAYERPIPTSQWQQFQIVGRLSSSWSTYYDQPDSWQHQLYRTNTSDLDATLCHPVSQPAFPPDLPGSPSHSSSSPFTDHSSLTESSSRRPSSPLSSGPAPSVKEEPDDSDSPFIMELSAPQVHTTLLSQSLAPPTEVPLRATQASSEMRSMMTVFRLNPFAMHNGEGRGTVPVQHEAAHALEVEPLIFEFQLELDNLDLSVDIDPEDDTTSFDLGSKDQSQLRSFSPDFELHEARTISEMNNDPNEGQGYHLEDPSPLTSGPQSWELGYPPSEDRFSALSSSISLPHHSSSRRLPRLHNSVSHPYPQKAAAGDSSYASSSSSGVHSHSQPKHLHYNYHHHQQPRMAPPEGRVPQHQPQPQWASTSSLRGAGYHNATSRSSSTTYASSGSPGCDSACLPTLSVVPVRRWSLPDTHPHANIHAPAPFLV